MNLNELKGRLLSLTESLRHEDKAVLLARLEGLASVFPFNEYEYMLMFLLDKQAVSFGEYESLRQSYVSANRYLHLFELAPRVFGQLWGEQHVRDLDPRFVKPDRASDPQYAGAYDLSIASAKVEVKAARAIHTKKRGSVVAKALRSDSLEPFWMNYQQLKLDTCDVFVFIGVWVDRLVYWVLSNQEVRENPFLSHQHRGGIEYQIGITHKNKPHFDPFRVAGEHLGEVVIQKAMKGGQPS
jgi:hypothetical protein